MSCCWISSRISRTRASIAAERRWLRTSRLTSLLVDDAAAGGDLADGVEEGVDAGDALLASSRVRLSWTTGF